MVEIKFNLEALNNNSNIRNSFVLKREFCNIANKLLNKMETDL